MKITITFAVILLLNISTFASHENHGIDPSKKLVDKWTKSFVTYLTATATPALKNGVVLVSFNIDVYGKMQNIEVESEMSAELNEIAKEMVKEMPIQHLYSNGFIEGTRFILPIKFNLN